MWHQVLHIDEQLRAEGLDAETKRRLEANRGRVIMGLGQRTKSLLTMPEYVKAITSILTMPGMHPEFVSKNFEVFSKGRTIEVWPLEAGHAQLPSLPALPQELGMPSCSQM